MQANKEILFWTIELSIVSLTWHCLYRLKARIWRTDTHTCERYFLISSIHSSCCLPYQTEECGSNWTSTRQFGTLYTVTIYEAACATTCLTQNLNSENVTDEKKNNNFAFTPCARGSKVYKVGICVSSLRHERERESGPLVPASVNLPHRKQQKTTKRIAVNAKTIWATAEVFTPASLRQNKTS